MSEHIPADFHYRLENLQKQADRSDRDVAETRKQLEALIGDAKRAASDALVARFADHDRLWSERFERWRKDMEVAINKLSSLEADAKKDRENLSVLMADVKALREDKTDQKAFYVFIRNAFIGGLLSLGITWALHNPK